MKKSKAIFLAVFLLPFLFVGALWFQAYRILPSDQLHDLLVQKVQSLTEGTLKYQAIRVGYFPQPRIILEHPQLSFSNRPLVIEADRIQFDLNILPILLGRAEPAAFYVQSGKAQFSVPGLTFVNPVSFENFSLEIGAVVAKIPIPFHFVSDLAGKPGAFVMKGNVVLDSVEKWNWEKVSGSMTVEVKQLSLDAPAKEAEADLKKSFRVKNGSIDTVVEIKKKAQEAFLELSATGTGKGIIYEVLQEKTWGMPPALDAEWNIAAAWNQDTSELRLHKASVKLPFGEILSNGSMKLNTGEISGLRVEGSNMAIEDLLKYWPGLERALPFHVGFSGPGKWVLSTEGTLDHLTLHFAWDLEKVLLSYGQYFTKPKDLPLDLTVDLLLQKGALLGGDFAVKFKELSMKGNLKDFDLKTGTGQLNLITNKFSITGWEQYIPVFQRYKLGGEAKFMANWKGDLRELEKAEHIFNITFDKASWSVPEGPGIRNASLSLDYSPMLVEGRQMLMEVGASPVVADLKISGFPEKPQALMKIVSAELKPLDAWQAVTALFDAKSEGAGSDNYDRVKELIQSVCPKDQSLKNVSAEVRYDGGVWDVPALQFEGYGGKAGLKGSIDFKEKDPRYQLEGELQGVDFGAFLSRQDAGSKALEGTLHLKGSMKGTGWGKEAWCKSLEGQGEFTMTQGKFLTFDLKETLVTIEPFQSLGNLHLGFRDFESMNFQWKITEAKAVTNNLLVKSKDYVLDGEGTLGFDGLANFRVDVFLTSGLAAKLLPKIAEPFEKNPRAYLGPIPTLLSGPLMTPEVKPDPVQVAELTEKIHKGKSKQILCELVLE